MYSLHNESENTWSGYFSEQKYIFFSDVVLREHLCCCLLNYTWHTFTEHWSSQHSIQVHVVSHDGKPWKKKKKFTFPGKCLAIAQGFWLFLFRRHFSLPKPLTRILLSITYTIILLMHLHLDTQRIAQKVWMKSMNEGRRRRHQTGSDPKPLTCWCLGQHMWVPHEQVKLWFDMCGRKDNN